MKISETITYAAPPETVYAMVTDRAFQERKCVEAGAQRHEASVSPAGDGSRVVTKRDLPADDLPDFAKSIVGPNLSVTGSLATILWLAALRREGVQVRALDFLRLGLLVMPPALILSLIASTFVSP